MKLTDIDFIEQIYLTAGSKLLLNPTQLEELLGISTKQQSKLRTEGRFPIPFKNIGRLVYYSIYDVADFLLNGESTPSKEVHQEAPVPIVKKKPSKAKAPVQDLSHIFLIHAFSQSLEERVLLRQELAYQNKGKAS
ncbi:helix-turn-helix transcriptional regulator [Paracidovorax konjaci]|uniref:helix-turn-helix transcriptional regulator n=1 Tax=Paracidovorax konjaci TaxID=32040 RepID=UPI0011135780|nr:hypothetical protein [Paracidovorax konjaci]